MTSLLRMASLHQQGDWRGNLGLLQMEREVFDVSTDWGSQLPKGTPLCFFKHIGKSWEAQKFKAKMLGWWKWPFSGGCHFSLVQMYGEVTSRGSEWISWVGQKETWKIKGYCVGEDLSMRSSYDINPNESKFHADSPKSRSTWYTSSRLAYMLSSVGIQ